MFFFQLTISEEELEEVNSIVMDDARTIMRKANVVSLTVSFNDIRII